MTFLIISFFTISAVAAVQNASNGIILNRIEITTVSGTISDSSTGSAISGATVSITGNNVQVSDTTDAQGRYSLSFDITGTINIDITASKAGYNTNIQDRSIQLTGQMQ